jgi:tRNA-specific 2-thiouridylase
MKHKAIALYSGGLDSTLAILLIQKQNIEVTAVTFLTDFGCDASDTSSCSRNPAPAAAQFGFSLKLCHLSGKFTEIVKKPRFGHGKNMNPCIDCRILMLREAGTLMDIMGADFIVTGEVLGQRPMSQRRDTLHIIDRESGLKGRIVRPLSAKLLRITIPEELEIIQREKLLALSGRSRKPQMALAREFGLTDYPSPAGGCLLTDPIYSRRLQDLLRAVPDPCPEDLALLRIGRHFRMSQECKIIVGRDEKENELIAQIRKPEDVLIFTDKIPGPHVLLHGRDAGKFIEVGASLCARYSDAKRLPEVSVRVSKAEKEYCIGVSPAAERLVEKYAIR